MSNEAVLSNSYLKLLSPSEVFTFSSLAHMMSGRFVFFHVEDSMLLYAFVARASPS